ncbi:formylglycine-generating enzyme family protein [candidate division KSB1 bacterium]|nr:formylglycine-generating enzyme family protein [candidate division KSB1 bacterium]
MSKKSTSKKSQTDLVSQKKTWVLPFAAVAILGWHLAIQGLASEQVKPDMDEMVAIPAGYFMMGSNDGGDNEKPVHKVYVSAFLMDKYEVTVAQYQRFIAATGHRLPENWNEQLQNPNRPAVNVDWNDANAYANWAGKRLPTETEWEYAARGGNTGMEGKPHYQYPWGNEASATKANFDVDGSRGRQREGWGIAKLYLKDVGSYSPNSYGLYDMAGNVWEWCTDWFDPNYYKTSPERTPKGPANGTYRVLRGGSWYHNANSMRCFKRRGRGPAIRGGYFIGIRCARDAR